MAWLADQAHSRDLKLGLYMAVSKETCRQYPGSQVTPNPNPIPIPNPNPKPKLQI